MANGVDKSGDWKRWMEREVGEKSDKAVVKSEVKRLDEKIDELTGKVGTKHPCEQEARIAGVEQLSVRNQEAVQSMYKWYARGFAAVILVLLTSGAMFVWYLAGLSYNLEANNKVLEQVEDRHRQEDSASRITVTAIEDAVRRAVEDR